VAEIKTEQLGTLIQVDELVEWVHVDEDLLLLVVDSKYLSMIARGNGFHKTL